MAVCLWTTVGMLLARPNATLRSKLTEKVKYRPAAAIEPLLPAGTDALDDLPEVGPGIWYVWLRRPGASGAYHQRAPRAPVTKVPEQNHYPTPLAPVPAVQCVKVPRPHLLRLPRTVHPVRPCPPPLWLPRTVHPVRPCLSPHSLRQPPLRSTHRRRIRRFPHSHRHRLTLQGGVSGGLQHRGGTPGGMSSSRAALPHCPLLTLCTLLLPTPPTP